MINKNLDGALLFVTGGRALALFGLSITLLELNFATVEWIGFVLIPWSMR